MDASNCTTFNQYVVEPRETDVLKGRGGLSNHHPGNEWYRQLIRRARPLYQACPKFTKIYVSKAIVQIMQDEGRRFLERSNKDGLWYEHSYKKAVNKTSQGLRERLRRDEDSHVKTENADPQLLLGTGKIPPDLNFYIKATIDRIKATENKKLRSQEFNCDRGTDKKNDRKLKPEFPIKRMAKNGTDTLRLARSPDLYALADAATAVMEQKQGYKVSTMIDNRPLSTKSASTAHITNKAETNLITKCAPRSHVQLIGEIALRYHLLRQNNFLITKLMSHTTAPSLRPCLPSFPSSLIWYPEEQPPS